MKQRILIVEDNAANRELLSDWLEARGFDVQAAENLQQARTVLEGEPPALVLLDVKLGAEDGLLLAKHIRQQPRLLRLPVIAVTAHAMITDQERVLQAGCDACISKPIDFRRFREQLDRCLATSAGTQKV